jgi:uncharacterized metal-binding protein
MCAEKTGCCENGPTTLIYNCSGASNVGQITHATALKAAREGLATMSCLAGVGAHLSGFVVSARDCEQVVVLDGCDQQCAKKVFEHVDIEPQVYLDLTQNDFAKEHGVPITEAEVDRAYEILKDNVGRLQC